jgi:hypothetical protein
MKLRSTLMFTVLAFAFAASAPARAEGPEYKVDPFWPKQLPNNWILGQIGGMTVDAQDHIWVFQRPRSLRDVDLAKTKKRQMLPGRAFGHRVRRRRQCGFVLGRARLSPGLAGHRARHHGRPQ